MQEFQDPSLTEQIAYDRYLQHKPREAMDALMADIEKLSHMVKGVNLSTHDVVAFEDLLSLVEAGMRGLVDLAFNPEEHRFFTSVFRPKVFCLINSFIHDAPSHAFHHLHAIAHRYTYLPRSNIKKPSLSVKTYIAGVATAITGAVGGLWAAPLSPAPHRPEVSSIAPASETPDPEPIAVSLPSSATQAESSRESSFESPYYASALEDTAKKDREEAAAKEEAIQAFKKHTQELLDAHRVNYRRYFIDRDAIAGITLPHNVKHAEGSLQRVIDELRPKVQNVSPEQFLRTIAPYIQSPKGKRDSRNRRSYLTDLLNDASYNPRKKQTSFVGNCEVRTSAYLTLTQELRPDLLSNAFAQVFKGHVRFGMSDGKKLFGVDGSVKKLKPFHLRGTALATPDEFFVEPYLTGKPYVPPETSKDTRYTREESVNTDSLLPGTVSDGLKTLDEEVEEELVEQGGVSPEEAVSLVAEAHRKVAAQEGCNRGGRCVSFASSKYQSEQQLIAGIQEDPDSVVSLDIDSMPLTPTLVRAITDLHYLAKLTLHEKGLVPDPPSPIVAVVDDDPSAQYAILPGDLMADLIRKLNLQQLEFDGLQYASRPLLQGVALQKELSTLRVPHALRPQFEQRVDRGIVSDEFMSLDYEVSTRISEYEKLFQQRGISTKDMPSKQKILDMLHKLPEKTVRSMLRSFSNPRLVIVPPVGINKLLGTRGLANIFSLERWSPVQSDSWKVGIADGSYDMPFDDTLHYKDVPSKKNPRTALEIVEECMRRYEEQGFKILPQEAYLPLQLQAINDGNPLDADTSTLFEPIVDTVYVPRAMLSYGRLYLDGYWSGNTGDYLRCRSWVELK